LRYRRCIRISCPVRLFTAPSQFYLNEPRRTATRPPSALKPELGSRQRQAQNKKESGTAALRSRPGKQRGHNAGKQGAASGWRWLRQDSANSSHPNVGVGKYAICLGWGGRGEGESLMSEPKAGKTLTAPPRRFVPESQTPRIRLMSDKGKRYAGGKDLSSGFAVAPPSPLPNGHQLPPLSAPLPLVFSSKVADTAPGRRRGT
jgi:hypothetical protein